MYSVLNNSKKLALSGTASVQGGVCDFDICLDDWTDDNDIVFVDASTTTLQLAEFLSEKKGITVITNGIPLAAMLVKKGVKTYCTGGEIFENSLANFGSFAEEFIQKFNIDIFIFSCHGVNEKGILTDPSLPETQIRKTAIAQSSPSSFPP